MYANTICLIFFTRYSQFVINLSIHSEKSFTYPLFNERLNRERSYFHIPFSSICLFLNSAIFKSDYRNIYSSQ